MADGAVTMDVRADKLAFWALASAVLGVAAAVIAYWLVLPAVVLGLVGIVLGVMARRSDDGGGQRGRDLATIAVTLGAVAVLLTPVMVMQVNAGEEWGRDCALNPNHDPNC